MIDGSWMVTMKMMARYVIIDVDGIEQGEIKIRPRRMMMTSPNQTESWWPKLATHGDMNSLGVLVKACILMWWWDDRAIVCGRSFSLTSWRGLGWKVRDGDSRRQWYRLLVVCQWVYFSCYTLPHPFSYIKLASWHHTFTSFCYYTPYKAQQQSWAPSLEHRDIPSGVGGQLQMMIQYQHHPANIYFTITLSFLHARKFIKYQHKVLLSKLNSSLLDLRFCYA